MLMYHIETHMFEEVRRSVGQAADRSVIQSYSRMCTCHSIEGGSLARCRAVAKVVAGNRVLERRLSCAHAAAMMCV